VTSLRGLSSLVHADDRFGFRDRGQGFRVRQCGPENLNHHGIAFAHVDADVTPPRKPGTPDFVRDSSQELGIGQRDRVGTPQKGEYCVPFDVEIGQGRVRGLPANAFGERAGPPAELPSAGTVPATGRLSSRIRAPAGLRYDDVTWQNANVINGLGW
jgi:hypothetical protein